MMMETRSGMAEVCSSQRGSRTLATFIGRGPQQARIWLAGVEGTTPVPCRERSRQAEPGGVGGDMEVKVREAVEEQAAAADRARSAHPTGRTGKPAGEPAKAATEQ